MPLRDGDVFAGFVIERFLGSGAMGDVYLARHPRLPRRDALKVLPAALTDNEDFRRRFEREADVAATLWHPHIVGIHDRGEFDGQLWISMDYVEGTDAGRLLSEHHPTGMPVREVCDIVAAVADALDFAHERQLLHRDVKPSNILLSAAKSNQRRILLADFGVARLADEVTGLTRTNMSVGSVGYAAPEQLMGERLDGRADQYGLAATAFRLLTGRMPFQHSNPAVVISKQLTAAVPPLSESRPDLAKLDRVLSVALAKEPNGRYPRCLDFARALRGETPRSHTPGAPRPGVSPESTTSGPETRAVKLRPGAAEEPDETRAIRLQSDAAEEPHKTRAMRLQSEAAEEPHKTRAMRLQPGAAAGPDKTRPMDLRKSTMPADEVTRRMSLRPEAAAGPDETTRMKLPPSAAASPQFRSAQPARPPSVTPEAGRGAPGGRLGSGGPPARPAAEKSRDSEFRKAIWILLAVLVLIGAVLAAALVWWKVSESVAPSRHRTVSEPSLSVEPGEVAIQTSAGTATYVISSDIIRDQARVTQSSFQRIMPAK
jgi:serine/threonine protein kinase, bacterial